MSTRHRSFRGIPHSLDENSIISPLTIWIPKLTTKAFFYPVRPDIRKSIVFFWKAHRLRLTFPIKRSIELKMSIEYGRMYREQMYAEKSLSYFGQTDMANLKDLSLSLDENIVKYLKTLSINKNVPFSFDTKLLLQVLPICEDRHWNTDRKEERTWDGRRRDGGTNSTLRIKEQEKRLTLNEHEDDDDDVKFTVSRISNCGDETPFTVQDICRWTVKMNHCHGYVRWPRDRHVPASAQLHLLKLHSSHLRTEQVDGSPTSSARWWTNLWSAAQYTRNLRGLKNAERHQWASSECWRHFWGTVIKNVSWCHDSTLSLFYT